MQIMMIGKRSMYRVSAALSLFLVIHPVHLVLVSSYAPLIVHQHILPVAVRVILPAVVRVIPTQGDLAQLPAAVRVILTRVLPGIGSVPIQALLPNPMALRVQALLPDLPHREAVRAQAVAPERRPVVAVVGERVPVSRPAPLLPISFPRLPAVRQDNPVVPERQQPLGAGRGLAVEQRLFR